MRTKTILAAAAIIAAGAVSMRAQSNVYSLNVVGYVNKAFVANGFTFVSNPLKGTDNSLNTIMAGTQVPDNTIVFRWDKSIQDFDSTLPTYVQGTGQWVPNATINPGEGFFVFAPSVYTNTFVGEVVQGSVTNQIGPVFNMIASPIAIGGSLTNVLKGIPALDNDLALQWDEPAQDFINLSTYVQASGLWVPDLNIGVGEGVLFYYNGTSNTNWVRTFTVQ